MYGRLAACTPMDKRLFSSPANEQSVFQTSQLFRHKNLLPKHFADDIIQNLFTLFTG
jgi:hypothetical protein